MISAYITTGGSVLSDIELKNKEIKVKGFWREEKPINIRVGDKVALLRDSGCGLPSLRIILVEDVTHSLTIHDVVLITTCDETFRVHLNEKVYVDAYGNGDIPTSNASVIQWESQSGDTRYAMKVNGRWVTDSGVTVSDAHIRNQITQAVDFTILFGGK